MKGAEESPVFDRMDSIISLAAVRFEIFIKICSASEVERKGFKTTRTRPALRPVPRFVMGFCDIFCTIYSGTSPDSVWSILILNGLWRATFISVLIISTFFSAFYVLAWLCVAILVYVKSYSFPIRFNNIFKFCFQINVYRCDKYILSSIWTKIFFVVAFLVLYPSTKINLYSRQEPSLSCLFVKSFIFP